MVRRLASCRQGKLHASAVIAKSRQELKGRNVVGVVLNAVAEDALSYGCTTGIRTIGSNGCEMTDCRRFKMMNKRRL